MSADTSSKQGNDTRVPRLMLRRASETQPVPVKWLWRCWIAAGKLQLLAGKPGTGKTTIALDLATAATRGGPWPDGTCSDACDVVIWCAEDGDQDTLNPRLRAAGADIDRVHMVGPVDRGGSSIPFDPARHMNLLRDRLRSLPKVGLLILDPVVLAVLGDSHKNAEVRRGLQPLADIAEEFGCAVLGVTHLTKGTAGQDPVERVTGSLAFGACPRIVLVTAKMNSGASDDRRILVRAKSNLGPDGGGFVYRLDQFVLDGFQGVSASQVTWGDGVDGAPMELLNQFELSGNTGPCDASAFLKRLLEGGPRASNDVFKLAAAAGYSEKRMYRARVAIGARIDKDGMTGGWIWSLRAEDAEDAHPPSTATSPPSGTSGS